MKSKTEKELMNMYKEVLYELKNREVVRTNNNPLGDYAEWLVNKTYGYQLEKNSKAGFDAKDENGIRYQIKSRWERGSETKTGRELNVLRDYEMNLFDYLIALIFDNDFNVKEAYMIPYEIIPKYSKYSDHQNGYIVYVSGPILTDPETINITKDF